MISQIEDYFSQGCGRCSLSLGGMRLGRSDSAFGLMLVGLCQITRVGPFGNISGEALCIGQLFARQFSIDASSQPAPPSIPDGRGEPQL